MTSPPPYGQYPPTYGQVPGYAGYPPPRPTNGMAIAALVCAFVFAPLGIVFGHMSLSQIKRSGDNGRGLAVAGLAISYVLTAVGVIVLVLTILFTAVLVRYSSDIAEKFDGNYSGPPNVTAYPTPDSQLPPFKPPATLGSNCQYPTSTEPASKPVKPPRTGKVPTTPAIVDATMTTSLGVIGLQLDNAKSPCTVNNFASLAQQGYFDGTTCHRLTTSPSLGVLQCGDPTGGGNGGPGYQFPNEYPTNQYRITDPALVKPVTYPRGTLAMANAGSGTNGSQFFIVYADSQLPPSYTIFGSVDNTGLATVDKVAAGGVKDGSTDGRPALPITITSMRVN